MTDDQDLTMAYLAGWKDAMGASCNGCAHQPHPGSLNYPEACVDCRRFYGDHFEKRGERR